MPNAPPRRLAGPALLPLQLLLLLSACSLPRASASRLRRTLGRQTGPKITHLTRSPVAPAGQRPAGVLERQARRGASFAAARRARASGGKQGEVVSPLRRMINFYESMYVATIGVGTVRGADNVSRPESTLRVVFDTGSSELWLASSLCTAGPCADADHIRYSPNRSETYEAVVPRRAIHTEYCSGELRGEVGIDDVRVGSILARRLEIGLISEQHGTAFQMHFDGVVGLGFPALGSSSSSSLWERLAPQLGEPQFAFYIHPGRDAGGAILWGSVDPRLHRGPLTWYRVPQEEHWTLELVALQVGNHTFKSASEADSPDVDVHLHGAPISNYFRPLLVIDSGSSFFTFGGDVFAALDVVPRSAPCAQVDHLPPVVLVVRDSDSQLRDLVISPAEYMIEHLEHKGDCFPAVFRAGNEQLEGETLIVLGELFLRDYIAVFRRAVGGHAGAHVGLAPAEKGSRAREFFSEAAAAAAAS